MKRTLHSNDRLLILNGDSELHHIITSILPAARILEATEYAAALKLMLTHEISVVVCHIEADYPAALAFFSQLKQQYPQTVSIILADHADSGDIVGLLKQAQIYRYMFKPLKTRLMTRYLEAAVQHCHELRLAPEANSKQALEEIKPVASERFASAGGAATSENTALKQSAQAKVKNAQRLFRRFILQQDYS